MSVSHAEITLAPAGGVQQGMGPVRAGRWSHRLVLGAALGLLLASSRLGATDGGGEGRSRPVPPEPAAALGRVETPAASGRAWPESSRTVAPINGADDCGQAWTWRNRLPQGDHLFSVAQGAGLFVAVGSGGTLLHSNNGSYWQESDHGQGFPSDSGTRSNLLGVVYGGSQFVAVGTEGTILTSSDGWYWKLRSSGTTNALHGVTFGNGRYVAVGEGGTVLSSVDGIIWWEGRNTGPSETLEAVTFGLSQFVAVGTKGTILRSSGGVDWAPMNTGRLTGLHAIGFGKSRFVAVGDDGWSITSTNGESWTWSHTGSSATLYGISFGVDGFVAVGADWLKEARAATLVSSDGLKWAAMSFGDSLGLMGVACGFPETIAVGEAGLILRIDKGLVLTNMGSGSGQPMGTVACNDSTCVASVSPYWARGAPGNGRIFSSDEYNTSWSTSFLGSDRYITSLAYGRSVFVAAGQEGAIFTSSTGKTWTPQTSCTSQQFIGVAFGTSAFVALDAMGNTCTSADGARWAKVSAGFSRPEFITYGGSLFIVGHGQGLSTSPDGVTWTQRSDLKSVRTVAFGAAGFVGFRAGGYTVTSPDGVTWTERVPSLRREIFGMTYSGSHYIAVGEGGTILTSSDGLQWSLRFSGTGNGLRGIAAVGSRLVVVGDWGTTLMSACSNCTPPSFLSAPASQTIGNGTSATLAVTVSGTAPFTYQWYRGSSGDTSSPISGVTGSTYTTPALSATSMFWVRVQNSCGQADSTTATMTVLQGGVPSLSVLSISTVAGTPGVKGSRDGSASSAQFFDPLGIAVAPDGTMYVCDRGNHTVRIITPGTVSTLAGLATVSGTDDGIVNWARFNQPDGIILGKSGDLYVADTYNHTIRKVTTGGVVSTFAGKPGEPGSQEGAGAAARFRLPRGLAIDQDGTLYVADGNLTIRKVTSQGVVSTLAGSTGQSASTDGQGSAARFVDPAGIALDAAGNVYVSDGWSHTIRRITAGGLVTTFAGLAGQPGSQDGTGSAARFYLPAGLAIGPDGHLYVADRYNSTIRRITTVADAAAGVPAGKVTTIAGTAGVFGPADGTGAAAQFSQPIHIAFDSNWNLFISDAGNSTIRKGTAVPAPVAAFGFSPAAPKTGQSVAFQDQSSGNPKNWSWNFGDSGTSAQKNPGHVYNQAGTFTVTLEVTGDGGKNSTSRTITVANSVNPPVASFSFSPSAPSVGQAVAFHDTSTGGPKTWLWDFGDGTASSGQHPTHSYDAAGTYQVSLTVTNDGGTNSTSQTVKVATATALWLSNQRVTARVEWRSQYTGESGQGFAIPQKDEFGYFYFSNPNNPEVFVKVLDYGSGNVLCFVGGLSDYYYKVTFRTERTGATLVFEKPSGSFKGLADGTSLKFASAPGPQPSANSGPREMTPAGWLQVSGQPAAESQTPPAFDSGWVPAASPELVLSKGKVGVSIEWRSQYSGASGKGTAIPQKDEFGFFYFSEADNPEVFVKVLNFGADKPFLLFWSGLTDLEYRVTFRHLQTGQSVTFLKSAGSTDGGADNTKLMNPSTLPALPPERRAASEVMNAKSIFAFTGVGAVSLRPAPSAASPAVGADPCTTIELMPGLFSTTCTYIEGIGLRETWHVEGPMTLTGSQPTQLRIDRECYSEGLAKDCTFAFFMTMPGDMKGRWTGRALLHPPSGGKTVDESSWDVVIRDSSDRVLVQEQISTGGTRDVTGYKGFARITLTLEDGSHGTFNIDLPQWTGTGALFDEGGKEIGYFTFDADGSVTVRFPDGRTEKFFP